jgi:hypothetical protein
MEKKKSPDGSIDQEDAMSNRENETMVRVWRIVSAIIGMTFVVQLTALPRFSVEAANHGVSFHLDFYAYLLLVLITGALTVWLIIATYRRRLPLIVENLHSLLRNPYWLCGILIVLWVAWYAGFTGLARTYTIARLTAGQIKAMVYALSAILILLHITPQEAGAGEKDKPLPGPTLSSEGRLKRSKLTVYALSAACLLLLSRLPALIRLQQIEPVYMADGLSIYLLTAVLSVGAAVASGAAAVMLFLKNKGQKQPEQSPGIRSDWISTGLFCLMIVAFWYLDYLPFRSHYSLGRIGSSQVSAVIVIMMGVILIMNDAFYSFLDNIHDVEQEQEEIEPAGIYKTLSGVGMIVVLFLVTALWATVLWFLPRGFDLSDDGYYLLHAAHYRDVYFDNTLFGLVTSHLYHLAGSSIAAFRVLGGLVLLLSVIAAVWTAYPILTDKIRHFGEKQADTDRYLGLLFIIPPIATAALYYRVWLSSPSYNWLAFIACLWVWSGIMILLRGDEPKYRRWGGMIIGFSGAVSLWARPSTAAVLPIICLAIVLLERQSWRKMLKAAAWAALGLAIGFCIPLLQGETPFESIEKIRLIFQVQSGFGQDNVLRTLLFPFEGYLYLIGSLLRSNVLLVLLLLLLPIIFRIITLIGKIKIPRCVSDGLLVTVWALNIVLPIAKSPSQYLGGMAGYIYVLTFLLWFSSFVIPSEIIWERHNTQVLTRSLYGVAFGCAVIVGTSNRLDFQLELVFAFFALSVSFLLIDLRHSLKRWVQWYYAPLFVIGTFIMMIYPNGVTAYRQESYIWAMNVPTPLRFGSESVLLSEDFSEAFITIQDAAIAHGLRNDTPIIDMTGGSPGLVYLLSGRSYAFPWLPGSYPGSEDFARSVLSYWPDGTLEEAWILTSDGYRELPTQLLNEYGLNFPDGYEQVVTIHLQINNGISISLWKPVS